MGLKRGDWVGHSFGCLRGANSLPPCGGVASPLSGASAFRATAGSRISARTHAADGRYRSASRRRTRPSRWPLRSKTFQPPGLPVAGGPAKTPATGLGSALHPHPTRFRASGTRVVLSQCLSANSCRLNMLWPGCPIPHPFRAGATEARYESSPPAAAAGSVSPQHPFWRKAGTVWHRVEEWG